jgi:hypothetical protein
VRLPPAARRATIVAALAALLLSGCASGSRAEHGDASFCTYYSEVSLARFEEHVRSGFNLAFEREIVDGQLRALAAAIRVNVRDGSITTEEGRDQILQRCRAIRAL